MQEYIDTISSKISGFWGSISNVWNSLWPWSKQQNWCDKNMPEGVLHDACESGAGFFSMIQLQLQGLADTLGVDVSYVYAGGALLVSVPTVGYLVFRNGKQEPEIVKEGSQKAKALENQGTTSVVRTNPKAELKGGFRAALNRGSVENRKTIEDWDTSNIEPKKKSVKRKRTNVSISSN